MNSTLSENGLVPSRLVLGMVPRFSLLSKNMLSRKKRKRALKSAQAEINSIMAEELSKL